MDMKYIDYLLDDQSISEKMVKAESIEEKQLIAMLLIRNNLMQIRGWVTFFGVLAVIGIVINIIF